MYRMILLSMHLWVEELVVAVASTRSTSCICCAAVVDPCNYVSGSFMYVTLFTSQGTLSAPYYSLSHTLSLSLSLSLSRRARWARHITLSHALFSLSNVLSIAGQVGPALHQR